MKGIGWSLVFLQGGLLACLAIAVVRLSEARASFVDSSDNLQRCEQLATEIEQLRQKNSIANDQSENPSLENSRLLEIASKAGVHETLVASIQQLAASPIEGEDYEQQSISLQLNGVSLQQVIGFLLQLESEYTSAKATSVNLRVARGSGGPTGPPEERWNAQLILTQLVYLARSARR